jgi:hypothetical protein
MARPGGLVTDRASLSKLWLMFGCSQTFSYSHLHQVVETNLLLALELTVGPSNRFVLTRSRASCGPIAVATRL